MNNNNNNNNYNIMNNEENSQVRDFLSLIPSTILTLVASLSDEDKRVLAYLISCSNKNINYNNNKAIKQDQYGSRDHLFECDCFECYVSFWARWDASEKRHVIHEIIEDYEEDLATKNKKNKKKIKGKTGNRVKKSDKRKNWNRVCDEPIVSCVESLVKEEEKIVEELSCFKGKEEGCDNNQVRTENKDSFRRFLSYVGEKVFAFWS